MAEKIDPIKYAENLMDAWKNEDELAVDKIEETYGDQEVTLKDLESMFAYAMQTLTTAYAGLDTLYEERHENVLELLVAKRVITEDELKEYRENDEELQQAILGYNEEENQ